MENTDLQEFLSMLSQDEALQLFQAAMASRQDADMDAEFEAMVETIFEFVQAVLDEYREARECYMTFLAELEPPGSAETEPVKKMMTRIAALLLNNTDDTADALRTLMDVHGELSAYCELTRQKRPAEMQVRVKLFEVLLDL